VTWGQFFIYQGFNATAGWMHTSSGVDNIDEFLETAPLPARRITVPFKTETGMARKTFTVYYSKHGPIVRKEGDRLVSISLMSSHVKALIQSYSRTKARDLAAFLKIMESHTNSSNNTVFADATGNIAYFHSNYIPRRDSSFDWTKPVDGSNPATRYHGVLSFAETPNVVNPSSGWVYNANNWPWSAAGEGASPKRETFPRYVETGTEETARGYHALRLLEGKTDWTTSSLTAAAFDSYLPAFERMIPPLLAAYDQLPAADTLKTKLAEPVATLRAWDYRWGAESVPASLAVFWGERAGGAWPRAPRGGDLRDAVRRDLARRAGRPARSTLGGGRCAHRRFRHVAHGVGTDQSLPAHQRRHSRRTSTTRSRASPCRSPRASGARSPPSALGPTPTRRSGTARAATASSLWSNSGTA